MSDELLEIAESRIKKLHRDLIITTAERGQYALLARKIAKRYSITTCSLAKQVDATCAELRRVLRRMEQKGLVMAHSNGSNKITWTLAT